MIRWTLGQITMWFERRRPDYLTIYEDRGAGWELIDEGRTDKSEVTILRWLPRYADMYGVPMKAALGRRIIGTATPR